MPITDEQLDNWFSYHAPTAHTTIDAETLQARYEALRAAGGRMARAIRDLTPPSADQTAAIRKVREAVFTANAALACEGR